MSAMTSSASMATPVKIREVKQGSGDDRKQRKHQETPGSTTNVSNKETPYWIEDGSKVAAGWCLVDHPEIWKRYSCKDKFLKSKRLMSLMNKPKNEIVKLPDAKALVRKFYCVMCRGIPFPWREDTTRILPLVGEKPYPERVYLCENGHAICRACYTSCFTCTASVTDLSYTNGRNDKALKSALKKITRASGSMGGWGISRLCLARISFTKCAFLNEMIREAEFACKYYYNWCMFRGKGKDLRLHELKCPFGSSSRQPRVSVSTCEQAPPEDETKLRDDDDDAEILSFTLGTALAETNTILRKCFPDWDNLNPRFAHRNSKQKTQSRRLY